MGKHVLGVEVPGIRFLLPVVLLALTLAAGPAQAVDRTIGGAIYTDLANPLTTGLAGVTVTVEGTAGTTGTYTATSAGAQGLWQMTIPEGTYFVTPCIVGKHFEHIVGGESDGQGSIQIVVNQANLGPNQSIQFLASNGVGAASPRQSTVDATSPVAPGANSTVTVVAKDACGNAISGAHVVLSAEPSGLSIIQPPVTDGNGRTTGRVTSPVAGEWTVSAAIDGVDILDTAIVRFQGPRHVVFTGQPVGPYAAGAGITVQVTVKDGLDNTDTTFTGLVTIAIGDNPAGGTLSGTTQRNAVAGVADFSGLSINKASTQNYTLVATAAGVTGSAESNGFQITAAAAASLAFIQSPGSTSANAVLVPNPQVDVRDTFGNRVTSSSSPVTITLVGPGTLSGTDTINANQGVATFTTLVVGPPGTFGPDPAFHLTASSGSLTPADSSAFAVTADPALTIEKTHTPEPADPNTDVVFTITYGNVGLGGATNTVIVETLPTGLTFVSVANGGVYSAANRTITWTIGTLAAQTTDQTVSFTARVADSQDGGRVVNSNLTIDCAETDAVTATPVDVTNIEDKQSPQVSGQTPVADDEGAGLSPMIRFHVTDRGGVDFDGGVKIYIEGDLVYDGSAENPVGQYDSTGADQAVRGVCRRTGEPNDYAFTFLPSTAFAYEQEVDVSVSVADVAGNTDTVDYSFFTQTRTFGANAKVNSDTGAAVQDNPAVATDPDGNIWIVWDQRATATSDTDVYIARLPADGSGLESSVRIYDNSQNQANPAITIDAAGRLYVVWEQWSAADASRHIMLASSTDGTTWVADPNTPPSRVDPAPAEPNAVVVARNPSIVVSEAGQVYVAWQQTVDGGDNDVWLRSFTQAGGFAAANQISTNTAEQTDPTVDIDPNGIVFVVWTDARNAASAGTDLYGARSDVGPWTEGPVVAANTSANQSEPVYATGAMLHLAWVDGNDLKFGHLAVSVLDPCELDALPRLPALAAAATDTNDMAFIAWVDSRDVVGTNGDTDIYFAGGSTDAYTTGGPLFGTNIMVNDDTTGVVRQTKPAVGVDAEGEPFIVWVDNRNGNDDIFYTHATVVRPYTVVAEPNGVTVPAVPGLEVVIPTGALPGGITANDITIQAVENPPGPLPPGGFGMGYDFGPSGAVFNPPVKIRIPLADGAPVYSVYRIYRYDTGAGMWTQEGIHNPAKKVTNDGSPYLEVQVDHFTTFIASGYTADGGGGGGGCALSPWSDISPVEFFLPFAGLVLVLLAASVVDGLRRRSNSARD